MRGLPRPKMEPLGAVHAFGNDRAQQAEGVQGLQADTKALMSQQKELMETMKSLEPMMDTAKGMLKSLDMGTLNKMTDLVGGLGFGKK